MNTTIVPPAPERTRDMGSVEQHSPARPPFLAECLSQLHDLERWFGTQLLADAVDRLNWDSDYQARLRTIRPDDSAQDAADAIRLLRSSGDPESAALADQIAAGVAAATPLPTAAPYPGAAAAPTAAYAA